MDGTPTKLPLRQLLTIIDYKTWYQIKVDIQVCNPMI